MGFRDIINKFKISTITKLRNVGFFGGNSNQFTAFGKDVYANDLVNACIRSIATEMSKLEPRHIISDGTIQRNAKSSINRLLKFAPNELMTTKDFLEKCTWLYEKNFNCFIYPKYELKKVKGGTIRRYTGFYPLNPISVDFLEDDLGEVYIKFYFNNSNPCTFKYSEIIHWRKDFSDNQLLGGDSEGNPKSNILLGILGINHGLTEGLERAVKSSLAIRGLLKINTMMDDDKLQEERKDFERNLSNSKSGIMPIDIKNDYIPINVNPTIVNKDTLEFIEGKIMRYYGVSKAIVTGNFTDEEYQAFYEKELEQRIIGLGQAFSKTLFTEEDLENGNEVIFYGQKLLFTNTKNKIAVADILGNRGALTDNQLLALFGYPPFEGGDTRHMSLNFIKRDIADEYQMNKYKKDKGVIDNE